ncbi:flavodoxin family protein [Alkalicella caledoniensis]|uniref:Flavodoxin family protein n=1 Tax=Alkalicella caledoniensis TaxID=2731377 RepID=A0A7G9W9P7_ALKCA|nr:flavodoxin family protein [Alkalicella caledoniensis]QNO15409.1 flavodoxin family protein [Alkalicella caledoniensis]
MEKRILVISSSPRHGGNSDLLCDQFVLGANDGGNQAEKIVLRDKEINFCLACDYCKKNKGVCIHNDDVPEVIAKMISADVIVMATPVYFYTMCGQMKTLIDRTYPGYKEMTNKEVYFIVTAAVGSKGAVQRTIEEFRGFSSLLSGVKEKGIVYGTGAWSIGDIKTSKAMQEAYEMGKNV